MVIKTFKYNHVSTHFKNNNHVFRKQKKLGMQENFIFVDTESNSEQIDDKITKLSFKMGCAIFWNRVLSIKQDLVFYDINQFWDIVQDKFTNEIKEQIMFAHNSQFDFKMLDGFNQLQKRGWELINHYVRNKVFILVFKKDKNILHVWDTTNYVPQKLKTIGKMLGFKKLEIDFNQCTKEELEVYCFRDVEIIFIFIKNLIEWLLENDLSRLKATIGSLSFNIFRHKFYNEKSRKIWIHDFKSVIQLERESYRGGITDCFKIGECKDVYKLDINSMYPDVMKKIRLPTKLIYYSHESNKRHLRKMVGEERKDKNITNLTDKDFDKINEALMKIYDIFKVKEKFAIIANCTVELDKEHAYLLANHGLGKSSFCYGVFNITICSPELKFVEKFGKILKIHEISIYKTKKIFAEFVDYFFNLKQQHTREKNKVYTKFTKLILNCQYGKWGQCQYVSEFLDKDHDYLIKNQHIILKIVKEKSNLIKNNAITYLGCINKVELYVIDKKIHISYKTKENSKESFVAIPSFITSQARMDLVKFILMAKRENCCYSDTDSLVVYKKGLKKLKHYIDDYELGKLKNEGFGDGNFYVPKFYDFHDKLTGKKNRKCKGINQEKATLIKENDKFVEYEIQSWQKLKQDLKTGNLNNQYIKLSRKIMNKSYDKGHVLQNGHVEPFHISEILEMNNV